MEIDLPLNPTSHFPSIPIAQDSFGFRLVRDQPRMLYGSSHILARQAHFNALSKSDRCQIGLSLFQRFDLQKHLQDFLHIPTPPLILDIEDIGMAHSVYKVVVQIKSSPISVVIKQERFQNQEFYTSFLQQLGWPSFESRHYFGKGFQWEISSYLGPVTLHQFVQSSPVPEAFISKLAAHAALGDLLGRGDRHFENYVVQNGNLYPIDISHLFDPDNDAWTARYISAGASEFGAVLCQNTDEAFPEKIAVFMAYYHQTLVSLKSQEPLLMASLEPFKTRLDPPLAHAFFTHRTQDISAYFESQKQTYLKSLLIFFKRRYLRSLLEDIVKKDPEALDKDPILSMYAQAHINRFWCFFRLEDFQDTPIQDRLYTLANYYLNLSQSHINNTISTLIKTWKDRLDLSL